MTKDEAVKSGAVAIFEEKYGEIVRVVEIRGYSKELCGGTHVKRSGDIGLIKIVSETSISAGTRRLEAVTGLNSLELLRNYHKLVKEISTLLNSDEAKVVERLAQVNETLRTRDREIEALQEKVALASLDELLERSEKIDGVTVVALRTDLDSRACLAAGDVFRARDLGILFLISETGKDKVAITVNVSGSYTGKIKAGDLARAAAKIVGGGGGGRPDFAQAGGRDPSKIDEALAAAKEMIRKSLA
jgi:alanyl-tRNA synthetase